MTGWFFIIGRFVSSALSGDEQKLACSLHFSEAKSHNKHQLGLEFRTLQHLTGFCYSISKGFWEFGVQILREKL